MGLYFISRFWLSIYYVLSAMVGAHKWLIKDTVPLFIKLIIRSSGGYREMNRPGHCCMRSPGWVSFQVARAERDSPH